MPGRFASGLKVLVAILLVISIGCGRRPQGPKMLEISGTVNFDGQPMADGDISFNADDGFPPAHGRIAGGKFVMKASPGAKRVAINQYKETGEKDYTGKPILESTIPERFNAKTELKAEVKADGPNNFTFDIQSK